MEKSHPSACSRIPCIDLILKTLKFHVNSSLWKAHFYYLADSSFIKKILKRFIKKYIYQISWVFVFRKLLTVSSSPQNSILFFKGTATNLNSKTKI